MTVHALAWTRGALLDPLPLNRLAERARQVLSRLRRSDEDLDRTDPAHSFRRQPATRWLEPGLLLRSAGQVVVSGLLGQYNDKRELMGALPADPPIDLGDEQAVWVDYVADAGDGFDATYAVASLLAREELAAQAPDRTTVTTRRGRLLVMGGDQCYPSADVETYEDRLIGPYRAALPMVADERRAPTLLVVPGNHDWYDGLTAFMRTFCQRRWIGGWRTCQSRSYFAVKLPGRWWLWGIDIQFDTYVDDVQRRYFEQVATRLREGDSVVLVSAKPSWVVGGKDDCEAYETLDFLERELVRKRGASVRLAISGDRHHYARYEAADGRQKLTAGGGGAYLSPTHHLPPEITVPPRASRARGKSDPVTHWRRTVYPDAATSRRLGWRALALPWRTPRFAVFLGAVHAALGLALASASTERTHDLREQLAAMSDQLRVTVPGDLAGKLTGSLGTLLLALFVLGAAVAFTQHPRRPEAVAAGLTHGGLQLGVTVGAASAAAALTAGVPGAWMLPAFTVVVFALGGLVGSELVVAYLLLADRLGINSNELFAATPIVDHKNFLRLHVAADGSLTVYPFAVDRVPRRWRVSDRGKDEGPRWLSDDGPLQARLIEPPLVLRGAVHERRQVEEAPAT